MTATPMTTGLWWYLNVFFKNSHAKNFEIHFNITSFDLVKDFCEYCPQIEKLSNSLKVPVMNLGFTDIWAVSTFNKIIFTGQ